MFPTNQGDSKATSEDITPPSSLLRAHAPDHGPLRASVVPRSWSLCRLSRVPAGPRPFPTLSLPSVCRCLDLYPAVFVRCPYPFLPQRQRPHVTGNTFGTRENPCKAISTGSVLSGLQSFANVQAPTLARPPDRSHRSPQTGRPGRLHHASPKGLPASGCGIATCLIWATDMAGLPPARWQPCRLLLPARRSSDDDSQHSVVLQPRIGQAELRALEWILPLDSQEHLPTHLPLLTAAAEHFTPVALDMAVDT